MLCQGTHALLHAMLHLLFLHVLPFDPRFGRGAVGQLGDLRDTIMLTCLAYASLAVRLPVGARASTPSMVASKVDTISSFVRAATGTRKHTHTQTLARLF